MKFEFRSNREVGEHAIVIGGSIAGILSARVLADHFAAVTIIETDRLPASPAPRKGVPQSVQPHILLAGGYRILQQLFPNIETELKKSGALTIDWVREFYCFIQGRWNVTAQSPSHILSFTCSRFLLEWTLRQQLAEIFNVSFVEQHKVTGLLYNASQKRVTGVSLRSIDGATENELQASLVVDASGRRSQASKWLEALGFSSPAESVVDPFLGYATRRYRKPKDYPPGWKVMLIPQSPPNQTRLGYLAQIEGEELIATLGGYGHDFPPTNNDGFLEFARSLPTLDFYEAIINAEPISPIYSYRATANRLYHYDKIELPNGFVCLGDAVCALCPVHGQGMSVSALSAIILQDWLSNSSLVSSNFQKKLARSNSFHWNVAIRQDSGFLTTQIFPPANKRERAVWISVIMKWYFKRLIAKLAVDPNLLIRFTEMTHLLKPPSSLFHPKVLLSILSSKS